MSDVATQIKKKTLFPVIKTYCITKITITKSRRCKKTNNITKMGPTVLYFVHCELYTSVLT